MRFSEAYKGSYLKAADLGGKTLRVTITSIGMEEVGGKEKVVASLKETDQKLVVNKVNSGVLKDAWGDEMTNCIGKVILLRLDETDLQGKRVPCIRIGLPGKKAPAPVEEQDEDDINV